MRDYSPRSSYKSDNVPWSKAVTCRAVRTMIGQELRARYEVPQDLPHEMLTILTGGTKSNSARLLCVLSGMGGTDAQICHATHHCRGGALLNHPDLVSIVSQHTWNSF